MKTWRNHVFIHSDFPTMISISLFSCCEKVLIHINIWMFQKRLVKFIYMENFTDEDYVYAKRI